MVRKGKIGQIGQMGQVGENGFKRWKYKKWYIRLGKLSNRKSNETWEFVPSGDDPPPLAGLGLFWTWDFIEMGWPPP